MPPIQISIVNNTVVCNPGSGHVRAHGNDDIIWESKVRFSLYFALLTGKGEQNWPFRGSHKPVSEVTSFKGALAPPVDPKNCPAYKYTVVVDGYLPLDPIIIVDE